MSFMSGIWTPIWRWRCCKRLQSTRQAGIEIDRDVGNARRRARANYLGDCPVLRSEGKLHELTIEYTPHSAAPLEEQVAAALERLLARKGRSRPSIPPKQSRDLTPRSRLRFAGDYLEARTSALGDILVFLPGAAEIRKASQAIHGLLLARGSSFCRCMAIFRRRSRTAPSHRQASAK